MATTRALAWKVVVLVLLSACVWQCNAQLRYNYYRKSCPQVESIVKKVVQAKFSQTFVTAPATLRLFFHDCFVEGCDASVIIGSTSKNTAEKDFSDNLSLAGDGFDTVIKAKTQVEQSCPNTVSCADILALATRYVIALTGGPSYRVELGRRDGRISMASRVNGNLPTPTMNVNQMLGIFRRKNLNLTHLVALSGGGHTLGFSHCSKFSSRIYGSKVDRTLNATYAQKLRQMCPRNVDPSVAIDMDPITPRKFDNTYFKNLQQKMGLFTSDQTLFTDTRTKPIVNLFASNPSAFSSAFVDAITVLGRVGVKTGRQGEIHRDCSRIN